MTNLEALNWFKRELIAGKCSDDCEVCNAMERAMIALEMITVAKSPIYGDFDDNGYDEIVPHSAKCPTCGHEFEFGTWNDEDSHHCPCGQFIDWSDVDV